jgi:hypothetical protein
MRAGIRLRGAVGQSTQTAIGVTDQPTVNRSPVHPITERHISDRGTRIEDLPHRQISLLNHGQLPKHFEILLGSRDPE